MAVRRARDFNREIPKVSRVAGSVNAPEQLSLDELIPGKAHGWESVRATEYGYIGRCLCGHVTRERVARSDCHTELRRHLARTPEGSIVTRNLRRFGRGGQGA